MESIGATARASGLTISALRFYDGAGVLVPAHVDPHSGYRFYAPDQVAVARLVATLRRTGMPLARQESNEPRGRGAPPRPGRRRRAARRPPAGAGTPASPTPAASSRACLRCWRRTP